MMIYLDNAATSFPKPRGVSEAVVYYLESVGATINRSVYAKAQDAGFVALRLRERLKRLFDFPGQPTHVILTPGATYGLNLAISGLLRRGDHCIVSGMEHNAVMRPLLRLEGVEFDRIPCDSEGFFNTADFEALIRPNTRLCVIAHGSNVCGSVQDVRAVGEICKREGIFLLLDAAQTAGHMPLSFTELGLSALCVPGHKGLLGPSGIGALLLTDELAGRLEPLISGGTGSASDSEYLPDYLPDRFEPGTQNMPGVYGLEAALEFIESQGADKLRQHEMQLCEQFLDGLSQLPGVRLCGTADLSRRVGVISLDFIGQDNADAAYRLETEFGILTRCGLHCAPSAHKSLGTFPGGTVRFSIGHANTAGDISDALAAISQITSI